MVNNIGGLLSRQGSPITAVSCEMFLDMLKEIVHSAKCQLLKKMQTLTPWTLRYHHESRTFGSALAHRSRRFFEAREKTAFDRAQWSVSWLAHPIFIRVENGVGRFGIVTKTKVLLQNTMFRNAVGRFGVFRVFFSLSWLKFDLKTSRAEHRNRSRGRGRPLQGCSVSDAKWPTVTSMVKVSTNRHFHLEIYRIHLLLVIGGKDCKLKRIFRFDESCV